MLKTIPLNLLPELMTTINHVVNLHDGQKRTIGTEEPYSCHPIRVASSVVDLFDISDLTVIKAALLHDVLEDCGSKTNYSSLAAIYGSDVTYMVDLLTREPDETYYSYIERLLTEKQEVRIIKYCDLCDNMRDLDLSIKWQENLYSKYAFARRLIADSLNDDYGHIVSYE